MASPRIALLPCGRSRSILSRRLPLSRLDRPLGLAPRLEGASLGDLGRDDHLILPPKTRLHLRPGFGTRARVSVLFREPRATHGHYMRWLRMFSHRRCFRVLTNDPECFAQIPNAVAFPMGGTWVPKWREMRPEKRAMCSLIASGKRDLPGRRLRHEVVVWARATGADLDIMGRAYRPIDDKAEGLAPYRYSVLIENTREPGYFSEKLVDALLCGTVPICWGAPDIGRYFDTRAMVRCESFAGIARAVAAASEADYAARYADIEVRAARAVLAAAQESGGQRP